MLCLIKLKFIATGMNLIKICIQYRILLNQFYSPCVRPHDQIISY